MGDILKTTLRWAAYALGAWLMWALAWGPFINGHIFLAMFLAVPGMGIILAAAPRQGEEARGSG